MTSTDVLIAGAGTTGLTLACELARHGVEFRILEQAAAPPATSRALAIHARTLEILSGMELAGALREAGVEVHTIEFHGGGRSLARICFDGMETPYPFILSVPQSATERILAARLDQLGGRIERQVRLLTFRQEGDRVAARVQNESGVKHDVVCRWLIGCDGAHSAVRHCLGLAFEGGEYDESFLLADVKIAWPRARDQLDIFFSADGVTITVPLGGDRYRIIAAVGRDSGDSALPGEPTLDDLQALFARRISLPATLSDAVWLSRFRVHHRKAARFRHGRVFLAGDSAHIHSPAGGQGMNTGIQDAANLAWKLALVNAGRAPESLLDTYSAEREPVARAVIALTDRITRMGTLSNRVMQRLRNSVLPLGMGWNPVQHAVLNELAELSLNYRNSPIVGGAGHFGTASPHPGDRAPLPLLPDGRHFGDLLRGTKHHLLLFAGGRASGEDISVLGALRRDFEGAYPHFIESHLIAREPTGGSLATHLDSDGAVHRSYGAESSCLFLVRPDGYVAYRSLPPDAAALHRFLHEIYGFEAAHEAFASASAH